MRAFLRFLSQLVLLLDGLLLAVVTVALMFDYATTVTRLQDEGLVALTSSLGVTILGVVAVVHLALPITLLTWWLSTRGGPREISYVNDMGQVSVSLTAVEEALVRTLENEHGVKRVHVAVRTERASKAVWVDAVLTLWDDQNINALNRHCQDLLRARFIEMLPEHASVLKIDLRVQRLNHVKEGDDRRRTTTWWDERRHTDGEQGAAFTPALAAAGGVDNEAGARLLATARQQRRGTSVPDDHHDVDPVSARIGGHLARRVGPPLGETVPPAAALAHIEAASEPEPTADQPPRPEEPVVPAVTPPVVEEEDDEDYANLYRGPSYPVPDDEDNNYVIGAPLPAEAPRRPEDDPERGGSAT